MFGSTLIDSAGSRVASAANVVADTARALAGGSSGASGGNWIIEHVSDAHVIDLEPFGQIHLPQFSPIHFAGLTIDMSITKHIVMLWIAAILLFIVMRIVARSYRRSLVPGKFSGAIEMTILFVRDEVVLPAIGEKGRKLLPYFLTLFFLILFANLFGLLPYASTPTGNINVTASLAVIAFLVIQVSGMVQYGPIGYFKGLVPPHIPIFVVPIMIVVEALGLFTKPFALCVRLFANMIAGHIVIFSLIGLIFVFGSIFIAPVSIAFALFIELLEIMIAAIQAYIFTTLTALFVGMAIHQEH
jgi:F-type H+-transporting ATPase subunit a